MNAIDFKALLLAHYKKPHNRHKGEFSDDYVKARGTNPVCGDDLEIGIKVNAQKQLTDAKFRARGCSICIASASMLMNILESVYEQPDFAIALMSIKSELEQWLHDENASFSPYLPEILHPLTLIKTMPARKKCVLLIWNALESALQELKVE